MQKLKKGMATIRREGMKTSVKKLYLSEIHRTKKDPNYWKSKISGSTHIRMGKHVISLQVLNVETFEEIEYTRYYEKTLINDISNELKSDHIFLDVGANMGIYSLLAANITDNVYAIEPYPTNSSLLLMNKFVNQLPITIYSCAFSNSREYMELSGSDTGLTAEGGASFTKLDEKNRKKDKKVKIYTQPGDSFLQEEKVPTPNVIKIDVEGAEDDVIEGLSHTIQNKNCSIIYLEIHEDFVNYNDMTEKLEGFGFNIKPLDRERGIIKAVKDKHHK